jgi:hypothetical protein
LAQLGRLNADRRRVAFDLRAARCQLRPLAREPEEAIGRLLDHIALGEATALNRWPAPVTFGLEDRRQAT